MNRYLEYVADKAKGKPEGLRSSEWPKTEKAVKTRDGNRCQFTGLTTNLEVHHMEPFHINPARENDMDNCITLTKWAHFILGHMGNWKLFNPFVKLICEKYGKSRQSEALKQAA